MVLEIATIDIRPGCEAGFEAGVRRAIPLFLRADGCEGVSLRREVEQPSRYLLFVEWQTLEHHTVSFRGSADFQVWRELVSPFFSSAPSVVHACSVMST